MKTYPINEIFCSLQGEGVRAGTLNVFVRFAGCNQTCKVETHGFDCDTEFVSSTPMTAVQIREKVCDLWPANFPAIIFTGGEPALHLDLNLLVEFHSARLLAIETNGSIDVSHLGLDWITVSPKVAEHAIRQKTADEVKYVRANGQGIPKPVCDAKHKLLSPAFDATNQTEALLWCRALIQKNPDWRLSVQQHKQWGMR